MRSIRTRLLISHSLPLLIIIFLTGFALDYVVETRILLPGFADELTNEAKLLAELTINQPNIWDDSQNAQAYLTELEPILTPNVSLFDFQGKFLSSTDFSVISTNPLPIKLEDLLIEDILIQTEYSRHLEASMVDVFVPVYGDTGSLKGVIQMTYHLEDVYGQFQALRRVIIGILTIGIFLGIGLALLLAVNMSHALRQITKSIQQLATEKEVILPEEQGPEEVRTLTRTVNALVTRLRTLETTRRKLLANLVHELGRPLGALLPAVQALEAGAVENKILRQELLAGMEDELGILRRLLDDLTGLYDQSIGSFVLEDRLIDLNTWLPNLFYTQREAARAKGLGWRNIFSDKLPTMKIDPERLAQAVGNLVNNAIKFTHQGGTIIVGAGIQTNEVWIQVQDTGTGIPLEDQGLIFTPFFRGRTETRFPQGMGLGLSIARDLVTAHQGRLEFESIPGEGSSFTIWLPVSTEERI
ncbi:MAG: sensor histidine kinase [Anaerolineae bacterium]|jgi:two-component system, OmpR family, sensor histidine kinase BaeS|nr:sensor histidine kinase [Anaerolineae bacterium]